MAEGAGNRTISITQAAELISGPEDLKNTEIMVFPNPTKDNVYVTSEENCILKISVMDLSGKTVLIKPDFSPKETIDLSSLKPGVYFLSIHTSERILERKVIKK